MGSKEILTFTPPTLLLGLLLPQAWLEQES